MPARPQLNGETSLDTFGVINGIPRSGATLTRRIIGGYSNIAISTQKAQCIRDYSKVRLLGNTRKKLRNMESTVQTL
jgi:hypothetical protein